MHFRRLWVSVTLSLMLVITGCGVRIGGVTISEAFPDKNEAALVKAAAKGDVSKVDALVASGVDVNAVGYKDSTPLTWVAVANNKKGFEALLKQGADPNQAMLEESTIVWWLAGSDRPELLELALQHGGDPNVWYEGETPLMFAMKHKRWKNYYLLLDNGANINLKDKFDFTVARTAVALIHYDKLLELLERGYKVDLLGLARSVEDRRLDGHHEQYNYREKVIEKLKGKGIPYPPPLAEPIAIRLLPETRAMLEQMEREGKLNPDSLPAKRLAQDRALDNEEEDK